MVQPLIIQNRPWVTSFSFDSLLPGTIVEFLLDFAGYKIKSISILNNSVRHHLEIVKNKIEQAIKKQKVINFLLPAFPAKSPNKNKTLANIPDMGEYLALKRLNTLCQNLKERFDVIAKVTVCSDGRVFGDLVMVSDEEVNRYNRQIKMMIDRHSFDSIDVFTLDDYFGQKDYDLMRQVLRIKYGQPIEKIRQDILENEAEKKLFNGLHRFVLEDFLYLFPLESKNQARKKAKANAYKVIQSSHAWSNLVGNIFSESIRLSIHPYPLGFGKISIALIPSKNRWATPWHNVVLKKNGQFLLVKRYEAQNLGAKLVNSKYGYPFFEIN